MVDLQMCKMDSHDNFFLARHSEPAFQHSETTFLKVDEGIDLISSLLFVAVEKNLRFIPTDPFIHEPFITLYYFYLMFPLNTWLSTRTCFLVDEKHLIL